MDKYSLEREVKRDIERELRIHGLKMNPIVKMSIDRHIRNYINTLDDARFCNPAFVEEMQQRRRTFVGRLMSHSEYGTITSRSFMMARTSYCKTYPCRDGNI